MEAVTDFIFLSSKITTDGDYSHEIKRCLLLGRKSMTYRQYIKKQRHHLMTKFHRVKAIVFSVVKYRSESWTIKKTESQRTDASEL